MKVIARLILLAAMALGLSAGAALAQYPARPITMLVAYAAGGSTDVTARILASYMEKYLGRTAKVVVVNRAGAGGQLGFEALAQAEADGYTIGFINTPNVLTIPIERSTRFHWTQYELLGNILDDPGGFSVHRDSEIKSLDDLARYAKANPNRVTVGTTGVGSDDHLAMLAFERLAGVKMVHVPFAGAAPVRAALEGRHIDVGAVNIGEAKQHSESGSPFRNLGQMSQQRVAIARDVPTFKELGYDMEMASLRGVAAPKGLPAAVRERLADAVAKAAADPEFQAKMVATYSPLRFLAPADYARVLEQGELQYKELWKQAPWAEKK
ncbi:MAG: tripartite tricarboxylate transporter substrate binding protein [Variibacter sp.]|nr:tripartite tricarboxylate transporter substrate binding protein [Variibacter sp.]